MVTDTIWTLTCAVTAIAVRRAANFINGLNRRRVNAEDEAARNANVGRADQPCDGRRSRPLVSVRERAITRVKTDLRGDATTRRSVRPRNALVVEDYVRICLVGGQSCLERVSLLR